MSDKLPNPLEAPGDGGGAKGSGSQHLVHSVTVVPPPNEPVGGSPRARGAQSPDDPPAHMSPVQEGLLQNGPSTAGLAFVSPQRDTKGRRATLAVPDDPHAGPQPSPKDKTTGKASPRRSWAQRRWGSLRPGDAAAQMPSVLDKQVESGAGAGVRVARGPSAMPPPEISEEAAARIAAAERDRNEFNKAFLVLGLGFFCPLVWLIGWALLAKSTTNCARALNSVSGLFSCIVVALLVWLIVTSV